MLLLLSVFCTSLLVSQQEERAFVSWMRDTSRFYSGEEYHFRLGIFLANLRYIQEHNSHKPGFRLGLTSLAALTPSEYASLQGVNRHITPNDRPVISKKAENDDIPDSYDWREKGVVNEIKDQGACGSCWAFSVIQCMESYDAIQTGKLLRYSEQCLIDCAHPSAGCYGGVPVYTMEYIIANMSHHVNLESDYPYIAAKSTCKFDLYPKVGNIPSWHPLPAPEHSEIELARQLIKYGPPSACLNAQQASFQLYTSGIYQDWNCNPLVLTHAVGIVGYGSGYDEGGYYLDYWILRNTFGKSWGESGYMRFLRNKNHCGIAYDVAFIP